MHPMILAFAVLSGSAATPPASSDITGAASPLLPSLCRPLDGGDGTVLRCAGLVGTDVFLKGTEEARAVALGRPDAFLPPPDGARLGRSVSWRILGDRPIAAILRYRFPGGAPPTPDMLVVVKPPAGAEAGCVVGAVEEGGAPSEAGGDPAEALADRRAPLFRCGRDRPALDGSWSGGGRARAAGWLGAVEPDG